MRTLGKGVATATVLLAGWWGMSGAAPKENLVRRPLAKALQAAVIGDRALVNINNLSLWFKRDGYSAGNPYTDNAGLTYPRSTTQAVYRDGLVWGGKVRDGNPQLVRVGGSTHAQGWVPGRILRRGVAANPADPRVRIYRARRDWQTADLRREAAEFLDKSADEVTPAEIEAVRTQYALDRLEWPGAWGAPYYDRNNDGQYDAAVDDPGLANADQVAWFVVNDLDAVVTAGLYGSVPTGLECQVTTWAYNQPGAVGDAVYRRYRVVYKGTASTPGSAHIDDLYFAQWSDPDLGDYADDFAGCDPGLGLGYAYNSRSTDTGYAAYGLAPPAFGYAFLNRAISSFTPFAAGSSISDPELGSYTGALQWYNLLQGYQPLPDLDAPVPFTNPLTGLPSRFVLDGTPTIRDYTLRPVLGVPTDCAGDSLCEADFTPTVQITGNIPTSGGQYSLACLQPGDEPVWELRRGATVLTTGVPRLVGGQEIALPAEGISVVIPPAVGMASWSVPSGEQWLTWIGADFGAEGFEGAITADPNRHWFTSSTVAPGQTRTVELRFTSVVTAEGEEQYRPLDLDNPNVSYAYRYLRRAGAPAPAPAEQTSTTAPYDWSRYIVNPSPGYAFQDRSPICLSAWDVDSEPPRRLEVGFLENNVAGGLVNGAYGPAWGETIDNVAATGPREWLFVFDLPYTADPAGGSELLRNADLSGEPTPLMWIVYAARREEERFPQDGDVFRMVPWLGNVCLPGDTFTYDVPSVAPPLGWVDGTVCPEGLPAGDRRIVLSTGPTTLSLGGTVDVVVAALGGLGQDNLASLAKLKTNAAQVRATYEQLAAAHTGVVTVTSAAGETQDLEFGLMAGASDGLDLQSGEMELPPVPPTGEILDARFLVAGGEGLWRDLRDPDTGTLTWRISVAGGLGGYPVTLTWDPQALPPDQRWTMESLPGVVPQMRVDMAAQSSVLIATAEVEGLVIKAGGPVTVPLTLPRGWSMVSLPVVPADSSVQALFPDAVSAFRFAGGYQQVTYLHPCQGYWLNLRTGGTYALTGDPVDPCDLAWPRGWGMAGVPIDGVVVNDIVQDPLNSIISIFGFIGGYQLQPGTNLLTQGAGFWFNLRQVAQLTMHRNPQPAGRAILAQAVPAEAPMLWAQSGQYRQPLGLDVEGETLALPPPPPADAFDARVLVGGQAQWGVPAVEGEYPVRLQGTELALGWSVPEGMEERWELAVGDQVVALAGNGSVTLPGSQVQAILRRLPARPREYHLSQNYPNPFNPATTVGYELAGASPVSLRIYDLSGQLVRQLVSATQSAGRYQAAWDGRDRLGRPVASGVYFSELRAGEFHAVRRMMLIR